MDILVKIGVALFVAIAAIYMVGEVFFTGQGFGADKWWVNLIIATVVFLGLAILELYGPELFLR
jgi:hypothetical protein